MADRRRRIGVVAFVLAFAVFYAVGRWTGGLLEGFIR